MTTQQQIDDLIAKIGDVSALAATLTPCDDPPDPPDTPVAMTTAPNVLLRKQNAVPVITSDDPAAGVWESDGMYSPDAIELPDGSIWLEYSGTQSANLYQIGAAVLDGNTTRHGVVQSPPELGCAESSLLHDGEYWRYIASERAGNLIGIWEQNGTDLANMGPPGLIVDNSAAYRSKWAGKPCVRIAEGEHRMMYTGSDGTNVRICLATNDGTGWTDHGVVLAVAGEFLLYPFVMFDAENPPVLFVQRGPNGGPYELHRYSGTADWQNWTYTGIALAKNTAGELDDWYCGGLAEAGGRYFYHGRKQNEPGKYRRLFEAFPTLWLAVGGPAVLSDTLTDPDGGAVTVLPGTATKDTFASVPITTENVYEFWLHDNGDTTDSTYIASIRAELDAAGAFSAVICIRPVISSTHWVLRPANGAWTPTSIARVTGWHAIRLEVTATGTRILIDGVEAGIDSGVTSANLLTIAARAYTDTQTLCSVKVS